VRPPIFDNLRDKGLLYHVEDYTHRYPVCWRCKTELVFRLVDEWFISMDELRHDMMAITKQIRWIPVLWAGARAGLAAQHARLDDQQKALLGPGAAHLGVRRLPPL
jgi:isoleucyl-tRNA synthetase